MNVKSLLRRDAIRTGCALLRPWYQGIGSIHVLHRILPEGECSALPDNRALEFTPGQLREAIRWLRDRDFEFISMDDLPARLGEPGRRPFIAFTLDDGYRDNLLHALPVFREFNVPFTVNVTSAYADGTDWPWWYELEEVVLREGPLVLRFEGHEFRFELRTKEEQSDAFCTLARLIRGPLQSQRDAFLEAIRSAAGMPARIQPIMMNWEEVRVLASDPLASIGAHGVQHLTSKLLSDEELEREFAGSKKRIEEQIGMPVRHLAYPFGGREAVGPREFGIAQQCGFATMVTTRNACLFPAHARRLDALPRLAMSGNYPVPVSLERLQSGLSSVYANGLRRVVTE